jgi:hypothetical protein
VTTELRIENWELRIREVRRGGERTAFSIFNFQFSISTPEPAR